MPACRSCGRDIAAGARFCGSCGAGTAGPAPEAPQSQARRTLLTCAACGRETESSARFCAWCGRPLGAAPPAAGAPPSTQPRRRRAPSRRVKRARLLVAAAFLAAVVVGATAIYVVTRQDDRPPGADGGAGSTLPANTPIGKPYGGGVLAYILVDGDPGYVPGETHGLIAATADQTTSNSGIQWATEPYWDTSVPGFTSTDIGSDAANTDAIIAQNGEGASYAAGLARAYSGGGHHDWYLPSKDELTVLYLNREAIGGFDTEISYYWSSSEYESNAGYAWYQDFGVGNRSGGLAKGYPGSVRAVRAF